MTELLDADLLLNYDDALSRIEELRVTLEDALSSAADAGTAALAGDFKDAFSSLADDASGPIGALKDDIAASLASASEDGAASLTDALGGATSALASDLTGAITDGADAGGAALSDALTTASDSATGALTDAITTAAADGGQALESSLSDASTAAGTDLASALTDAADQGASALTDSFGAATSTVSDDLVAALTDAADQGGTALESSLGAAGDSAAQNVGAALDAAIADSTAGAGTNLEDALTGAFDTASLAGAGALTDALGPSIDPAIAALGDALLAAIQQAADSGGQALADALTSAADQGGQALGDSLDASTAGGGAADSIAKIGTAASQSKGEVGGLVESTALLGGATKLATGNVGGLNEAVGGIGLKSIGAVAGIGVLVEGTHKLIEAGITGAAAEERFTNIIGSFSDQVKHVDVGNLSVDIDKLGLSLGTVPEKLQNSAANIFQLGVNAGLAKPKVAEVTDQIIALAARAVALKPSLGDVSTVADQMALRLGRGGIRVQQYGVQLTSAQISAEALRETHKTLTSELTPFEKTVAGVTIATQRYGNSLKEDIAKGTDNAEIKQRSFNAQIQHFIESVGKPLVTPFFDTIQAGLPGIEALAAALGKLATAAMPAVLDITKVLTPVLKGLGDVIDFIGPALPPMIDAFLAFKLIGFLPTLFADIGKKALSAIPSMQDFSKNSEAAQKKVSAAAAAEARDVGVATDKIVVAVEEVVAAIKELGVELSTALGGTGEEIAVELDGLSGEFDTFSASVIANMDAAAAATDASLTDMSAAFVASATVIEEEAVTEAAAVVAADEAMTVANEEAGISFLSVLGGIGNIAFVAAIAVGGMALLIDKLDIFGHKMSDSDIAAAHFDEAMKRVTEESQKLGQSLFGNIHDLQSFQAAVFASTGKLADFIKSDPALKADDFVKENKKLGLSIQEVASLALQGKAGLASYFATVSAGHTAAFDLNTDLVKLITTQAGQPGITDLVTKALAGNKQALEDIRAEDTRLGNGQGFVTFEKYKDVLDKLHLPANLTIQDYAKLNDAQAKQVDILLTQKGGLNAAQIKQIQNFRDLQIAINDATLATYNKALADNNLTLAQQAQIEAFSRNTDGSLNAAEALKNTELAAEGAGPAFEGLGRDVAQLTRTFNDLITVSSKAAQSLPDFGSVLDKSLQGAKISDIFGGGIDTTGVTKGINDESKAITDFFTNVSALSASSPALADALLKLGPDNLGARTAAALAANQKDVRDGWEKALEGLSQANADATDKINLIHDQASFSLAAMGDAGVQAYAKALEGDRGNKGIVDLTSDELTKVALQYQTKAGPVGDAARTFVNTQLAQFTAQEEAFGRTAQQALADFTTKFGDPGGGALAQAGQTLIQGLEDPAQAAQLTNFFAQTAAGIPKATSDGIDKNVKQVRPGFEHMSEEAIKATKERLGIKSPSTVFQEIGNDAVRGFAKGLSDTGLGINKAVSDLSDHIAEEFSHQLHLTAAAHDAIKDFAAALADPGLGINKAATDVTDHVEQEFSKQLDLKPVAHSAIEGFSTALDDPGLGINLAASSLATGFEAELGKQLDLTGAAHSAIVAFSAALNDPGLGINKAADDVATHVTSELGKQLKPKDLQKIGHDATANIATGLSSADAIKTIVGVAGGIGVTIDQALAFGIITGQGALQPPINAIIFDIVSQLVSGLPGPVEKTGEIIPLALGLGIIENAAVVKPALKFLIAAIQQNLSTGDALSAGVAAGKAVDTGVAGGIIFNTGVVGTAVHFLAQQIIDGLKKDLKISSPSQVMFDLGQQTIKGYADGIESFVPAVLDAASKVAEAGKTVFSQSTPIPKPSAPDLPRSGTEVPLGLLGQVLPDGVHIEHFHVENVSPDPVIQGFEASRQLAGAVFRGGR